MSEGSQQPVLFFSLEMGDEDLYTRLLSAEAKIDSTRLGKGQINPSEIEVVLAAKDRLDSSGLLIEEKEGISMPEIRNIARKTARREKQLGGIVIDYLQIMGGADTDRVQSLGQITRSLKVLARELDCPVILLSQLSRGVESRTNKRPMMSDLRDSGSIEQDADLILMLYREEYYDPETPDKGIAEVIAVKNRNGPTGTVKLLFQPEFTLFLNRESYQQEEPRPQYRATMHAPTADPDEDWEDVI